MTAAHAASSTARTFKSRWLFSLSLVARSPLRIGDGGVHEFRERLGEDLFRLWKRESNQEDSDYNTVCTDGLGRPYIPGKTLKGILRSWARSNRPNAATAIEQVFGSEIIRENDPSSVGGKADFHDAFLDLAASEAAMLALARRFGPANEIGAHVPFWNKDRFTGVAASVAINRRTRTASDQKLFHLEYVPEGAVFDITITAAGLSGEEASLLRDALAAFGDTDPDRRPRIGAAIRNGYGLLEPTGEPLRVREMTPDNVRAWLKGLAAADECLDAAFGSDAGTYWTEWKPPMPISQAPGAPPPSRLRLDLELRFDAQFLVNDTDPRRTPKRRVDRADSAGAGPPDHAPRLTPDGRVLLPARSFRGVLRAQAERILRTIALHYNPNLSDEELKRIACWIDSRNMACPPPVFRGVPRRDGSNDVVRSQVIESIVAKELCLACQIFGNAGWASRVSVSDFASSERFQPHRQEFLALDRFTGGGADGLKFNAEYAYGPEFPTMSGCVQTPIQDPGGWMAGLLVLTLRDLCEGDMTFGLGAAKGYGAVRARLVPGPGVTRSGPSADDWRSVLEAAGVRTAEAVTSLREAVQRLVVGSRVASSHGER